MNAGKSFLHERRPTFIRSLYICRIQLVTQKLLFFNNKLVIPKSQIPYVLKMLNLGQLGIEKTLWKVEQHVYWPGKHKRMQVDIENFLSKCLNCQMYKRNNCKEPLQSYEVPHRPWERIRADLFYEKCRDFWTIYDSYSGWIELDRLSSKTAEEVIQILKNVFKQHGIPDNF